MIEAGGKRWISATEAPDHLGPDVTPDIVRSWARHGWISGHRVGSKVYYDLDALTEEEHRTRTSKRGNKRTMALTSPHALQS